MFLKDANNFTVNKASTLTTARTINGTSFSGSANITTANWGTARNITIGNTSKSVNGSGNVSWTLSEIGALPLTGGTLTGDTTFNKYIKLNAWPNYGTGTANLWYDANNKTLAIENATNLTLGGTAVSKNGHTHNYAGSSSAGGAANSSNAINLINGRATSANSGSIKGPNAVMMLSTSSMTTGKPISDGYITEYRWDTDAGWSSQFFVPNSTNGKLQYRSMNSGTWGAWNTVYSTCNKPTPSEIGAASSGHTHNYAGSSSAGGAANSANTLTTARTINGTSFNGSANITTANWGASRKINNISVNGSADVKLPLDYYTCSVGNDNTNLYHHILSSGKVVGDYSDKSITVLLVNHYNSSGFGIAKITLRTNQASNGATANGEIQWLVRSGFSKNQLCFNIRSTAKDTYMDVFYKASGTYNSLTWYVLSEGARGNHSSQWTKNNTNANGTNAYTEATMITLRSYTSVLVSATETGTTNYSNSAGCLSTARTINGTSFNGSANITTANWGTARNIYIADNSSTNTGPAVSVNGSGNATLKLPATIKATLTGNASTATKATQDSAGQQINTTYIKGLSVNGRTITYTKGDGTTGTITTQDTNTTYSTGNGTTAGLTKLYTSTGTATDGTMTQSAIKSALDGKANSSHNHTSLTAATGSAYTSVSFSNLTTDCLIRFDSHISKSATGLFAVSNNANAIMSINRHDGAHISQLGFSSNGNIYYRDSAGSTLTDSTAWKQLAFTTAATTSANGLMTAAMVTKLNGIATSANNYSHPTSSGNKHIPTGGSSGNWLKWSADGTAAWGSLPTASTSASGIVKLSSATNSTSTTLAATASAVKAAYDKANHSHNYLSTSGGTVAGNITLNVSGVDSQLIIYNNEGKKFILTTPYRSSATSDVTVTLPTGSGTIAVGSFIPISGTTAVSGSISPKLDNKYALGTSNKRWSVVYSSGGCLSSSDSKLKENIKMVPKSKEVIPYTTDVDIEESVCSKDLYNYVKNTGVYTYNLKNTERNTLGILADEIPENIFMKIGEYSKTEEEYQNELIRKEELLKINETLDVTELEDDSMVLDTGLKYSEFKEIIENEVEEPVRLLEMTARITMLQEVLGIALNKIEALEEEVGTLKEN